MVNLPNLTNLMNSFNNQSSNINQFLMELISHLKVCLNLDPINKKVKVEIIKKIPQENKKNTSRITRNGVSRFIEKESYNVRLSENYKKFFPYFLLKSAYLVFVPDKLKESNLVNYSINEIVSYDLQDFPLINEWKQVNGIKNMEDSFRFDKFLELKDIDSLETPKQYFFIYIRRYQDLDLDGDLYFFLDRIYQEFFNKSIKELDGDDFAETLRILIEIFYKVKNCDSLSGFFHYFRTFKKKDIIQTALSLRRFKKNLRWINKSTYITPTYYFDWKNLDIALVICYFKFNPILEKNQIDKIVNKLPFLIMPKLSISNFSVELSAYFVIPKPFLKDLIHFIKRMENKGYIIKKECSIAEKYTFFINLNYLRNIYKKNQILNPNNKNYSKDYEIEFRKKYNPKFNKPNLNLLEFLILERIRFLSYVGISFSRSKEISKVIKSDLNNFFINRKNLLNDLEISMNHLIKSPNLRTNFIRLLEKNHKFGFFYILNKLENWVKYFEILKSQKENGSKNFNYFQEKYKKENFKEVIETNEVYETLDLNSYTFKRLILNIINSREKYIREVDKILFYYKFLKLCYNLKIFSLKNIIKSLKNFESLKKIIKTEKKRLLRLKNNNSMSEISNESINLKINKFLKDPKIVKPYLINSIRMVKFASYFPQIILNNTPLVKAKIQKIKRYFSKLYFYESNDLFRNKKLIFLQVFIPSLGNYEKRIFLSIIQDIFKDNIISFKRFSWDGFLDTFSRIDFYDFYKRDFFYNKDLFTQYFTYVNNILNKDLKPFDKEFSNKLELVPLNNNFQSLIQKIRSRTNSKINNYELEELQNLKNFHKNLEKYLINKKRLEVIKKENMFRKYIKSILLYPAFQYFGLEQYYLYITPIDFENIDFKLLLMNTFQKIEYLASIQETNSLLIKFIFPYKEPNCSYLNWLRSKNKIIEYSLFSVISFNQILHFKNNLHLNDWSIDPNNFKIYTQKIISDSNYKIQETNMKSFKISNLSVSKYYDPKSSYFKELTDLYNKDTIDIKRNLNLSNHSVLKKIKSLMKKNIVFPYIRLKNLDLKEKIQFMLFNIPKNSIETIKKVFQYFNLVYLFEIEGEYYIHGLDGPGKIRNGLMIELYLPECELSEILRILEYAFQYLEVEKYLIIPDLVDGESFLKTIYGDLSFLEDYNPLNNLIWNERTKTWKNHTLFTQNFEHVYPDLIKEM